MTTNQIIALARAKLLEQTSEILTDTTLLIYANLTQQDIYKRVFPNSQILSSTVALSNGVGTLPASFGTLYGSGLDSSNNTYEEISIEDFDNKTLNRSMTVEGGTLKVFPSTLTSIAIKYYPTFADISTSVNPSIDSYFQEPIIYGILARAFEDLQDEELANNYMMKYEKMISDRIKIQSNYEESNIRGSQMFTYQNLISDSGISF
jgi:hypothetical protein